MAPCRNPTLIRTDSTVSDVRLRTECAHPSCFVFPKDRTAISVADCDQLGVVTNGWVQVQIRKRDFANWRAQMNGARRGCIKPHRPMNQPAAIPAPQSRPLGIESHWSARYRQSHQLLAPNQIDDHGLVVDTDRSHAAI